MSSTKIILTGHRGYIGSALKEVLSKIHPEEILPLVSDLRNSKQLTAELASIECDHVLVLHFATVNRRNCTSYENHATNCAMLTNLIRATDRFSQRHFLFASSSDVFGCPTDLPLTESSPHKPLDWYGLSKSVGETILRLEKVKSAIFRLPGVFGARVNECSLLRQLHQQGIANGTVRLASMGRVLRDLVYLDDLLDLFQEWIRSPRSGCWNVASGESATIHDSLAQLRSQSGEDFEIVLQPGQQARDFNLVFETSVLRSAFPLTAIRPTAQVLPHYAHAVRNQSLLVHPILAPALP